MLYTKIDRDTNSPSSSALPVVICTRR